MVIAVHNVSKPALGHRAFWVTLLLLLFTVMLAYQMSASRSEIRLGNRVTPAGWGISFAPPQRFARHTPARPSLYIPFVGFTKSGFQATFIVWQLSGIGELDPAKIPPLIFQKLESPQRQANLFDQHITSTFKMFGPVEGVEQLSPRRTTLVRSAVFSRQEVYAISLNVDGDDPIDDGLYDIFDQMCLSVQHR